MEKSRGQDARRIYEELDDFQSRKPIDVIKSNNPIMILDEPQKLEGAKTFESSRNSHRSLSCVIPPPTKPSTIKSIGWMH